MTVNVNASWILVKDYEQCCGVLQLALASHSRTSNDEKHREDKCHESEICVRFRLGQQGHCDNGAEWEVGR